MITPHNILKPPTSSSSLWDRLPFEIKDKIINEADIPTRFIHNYPLTKSEIESNATDIWIAVIVSNSWHLDLTTLSRDKLPTILNGLDRVTSREVYHQLCKKKSTDPESGTLAARNEAFEDLAKAFNNNAFWSSLKMKDIEAMDVSIYAFHIHRFVIPTLLLNIPMRQFWMDELDGVKDLDQLQLFFVAGTCGHYELFRHLYSKIFIQHEYSLSEFISTTKITLSQVFNFIMLFAAQRGYLNIIEFILTNINQTFCKEEDDPIILDPQITTHSIYESLKNGHVDICKLLLPLPNNDVTLQNSAKYLHRAVYHVHVIKFLFLDFPCVDLETDSKTAYKLTLRKGATETLKFLVSTFPDIRSTLDKKAQNDLLFGAVSASHLNGLKLILEHCELVDVSAALGYAVENGRLEVVKVLLNVPGIDVMAIGGKEAIQRVGRYGSWDVYKLLVMHPTVDVTFINDEVLKRLAVVGELDTLKALVKVPGVDPSANHNQVIMAAASGGCFEVVKFLMTLPGVDVHVFDDWVLKKAIRFGNVDFVKMMLGMPGICTDLINKSFLAVAAESRQLEILKLLLAVPGVDVNASNNEAVKKAASQLL
ncbi:hypothetical protein HDU76_001925 [Blyttiomyces sp. JEL0837]|nr:hypothetical protein HDU76_001925 [Blyttiomyces sp. JEL0837]